MEINYSLIGKRVAKRRKKLKMTQEMLSEKIGCSTPYISNIERAISIPSTETVMKLALALDTTPDEFLVGATRQEEERWRDVAQQLRGLSVKQLELTGSFLEWLTKQEL